MTFTNLLLVNCSVPDYQVFLDSVNASTCAVLYSSETTYAELTGLIQEKTSSADRIGFVSRIPDLLEGHSFPENKVLMVSLLRDLDTKHVDFLACNTLNDPLWKAFYEDVEKETGVVVGASSDLTGNVKYGGDWMMESTGEDIESIYFTQSIDYYKYLLDEITYTAVVTSNNLHTVELADDSYTSLPDRNDGTVEVDLPYSFVFNEISYNKVYIGYNGEIVFINTTLQNDFNEYNYYYNNYKVPVGIYLLHGDLNTKRPKYIKYKKNTDNLVVVYRNTILDRPDTLISIRATLYLDNSQYSGKIVIEYGTIIYYGIFHAGLRFENNVTSQLSELDFFKVNSIINIKKNIPTFRSYYVDYIKRNNAPQSNKTITITPVKTMLTNFNIPYTSPTNVFTLTDPMSNRSERFKYSSSNTTIASINPNNTYANSGTIKINILKLGTTIITATQEAYQNYPEKNITFLLNTAKFTLLSFQDAESYYKSRTIQEIKELYPIVLSDLVLSYFNSNQIPGLSATDISRLSSTQLSGMGKNEYAALSNDQVTELYKKVTPTKTQFEGFIYSQVPAIPATEFTRLTTQLSGMTSVEYAALSNPQVTALYNRTRQSILEFNFSWLTPSQLDSLNSDQIMSINNKYISSLNQKQIEVLQTGSIQYPKSNQYPNIKNLTATQIKGLTKEQLVWLKNLNVNDKKGLINEVYIKSLTGVIVSLTSYVMPLGSYVLSAHTNSEVSIVYSVDPPDCAVVSNNEIRRTKEDAFIIKATITATSKYTEYSIGYPIDKLNITQNKAPIPPITTTTPPAGTPTNNYISIPPVPKEDLTYYNGSIPETDNSPYITWKGSINKKPITLSNPTTKKMPSIIVRVPKSFSGIIPFSFAVGDVQGIESTNKSSNIMWSTQPPGAFGTSKGVKLGRNKKERVILTVKQDETPEYCGVELTYTYPAVS